MDAFFASVELLRYPQLTGLPVVIGGARRKEDDLLRQLQNAFPDDAWETDTFQDRLGEIPLSFFPRIAGYVGRGVITTATYAARQFGVGSAMGLMKAAKLCPQAILLPVDFDRYRHYSQRFKSTIAEIAPVIENRGIDEVFIDFTDVPGGQREGGRVLARLIQKAIYEDTGLTCSIGVAPNKLLAKIASELKKPNGISILYEDDLETLIWPLPCRKVNGIGPKAEAKLATHGIHTIGELAQKENYWLIENFGKVYGAWLHEAAHGIGITSKKQVDALVCQQDGAQQLARARLIQAAFAQRRQQCRGECAVRIPRLMEIAHQGRASAQASPQGVAGAMRVARRVAGQRAGDETAHGECQGGHAVEGALSVLRPGCGACNLTREADRERACRGRVDRQHRLEEDRAP